MMTMMIIKRSDKVFILVFLAIFCHHLLLQETSIEAKVTTTVCKESEREALLEFKQGLQAVDSSGIGVLSSWKRDDDECCIWEGVNCSRLTGHVEMLDFGRQNWYVKGTISPSLLKLHHLSYLDLNLNDFYGSVIPEFIGSLKELKYLDLSRANFSGPIPYQLGNLSKLETLRLGFSDDDLMLGLGDHFGKMFSVGKLDWLSHLPSLKEIDLSFTNLSKSSDWSQVIHHLPLLTKLALRDCDLPIPSVAFSSVSLANSFPSLTYLDLSGNSLTSSTLYPWLLNVSADLVFLDLSRNQLKGPIPESFGNMIAMQQLYLGDNQLEGEVFKFFGNMCSLEILDMESNHLSAFGFVQKTSLCTSYSLRELRLAENQLQGDSVLNEIAKLTSLVVLDVGYNLLNGSITESIGQLSNLSSLGLAGNCFNKVVISEAHFSNLTHLDRLDLSDTCLTLKFNFGWTPPFQLTTILLRSCKIGPRFPDWLRTQTRVFALDVSVSQISDSVPDWFWDSLQDSRYLNMSFNQINGTFPNNAINIRHLDLRSNYFSGPLPQISPYTLWSLNLSKNKFTDSISSICNIINGGQLKLLDLSTNQFSGVVPVCFQQFQSLTALNLADNNISGSVPISLGYLTSLQMLSLRGNNFSGELPSSLRNCTKLKFLDLSDNKLTGEVPMWIGKSLSSLVFLSLQRNQLRGKIPHQLCELKYLQILDLSVNEISDTIPPCLDNFTFMAHKVSLGRRIEHLFVEGMEFSTWSTQLNYVDEALLTWKGTKQMYPQLGLLLAIDISCNNLTGEIPEKLASLQQLVALNLSRNFLTGKIPPKIGQLGNLQVLDLSRNQFSGNIPASLSELTFLSNLDLSYNYLSGKIPTSTQLQSMDSSSFSHNQGLCGPPVLLKCSVVEPPQAEPAEGGEEDSDEFMKWFYTGTGLGFAVGFWGFCSAVFFKRSWRHSYYGFLDNAKVWLYVSFVLMKARLMRRIKALSTSCTS